MTSERVDPTVPGPDLACAATGVIVAPRRTSWLITVIVLVIIGIAAAIGGAWTLVVVIFLVVTATTPLSRAREDATVRIRLRDDALIVERGKDSLTRKLAELTAARLSTEQAARDGGFRLRGFRSMELEFGAERLDVAIREMDADGKAVRAELVRRARANRGLPAPRGGGAAARSAPAAAPAPDADRVLWRRAVAELGDVLTGYGAYELDTALALEFPAVTDVTLDHVAPFIAALTEAQALRTDDYPGAEFAARFRAAVSELRTAWTRCERTGRAAATGYLPDGDRRDLDTALKLLGHARGTVEPGERAAYLGRVREIVDRLERRGVVHLPAGATARLELETRRALEA